MKQTRARRRTALGFAIALLLSGAGVLTFAAVANATATLMVTPSTNLTNGESVTVSGSGFDVSAAGGIVECNSDPSQPTISLLGNAIPVSCTAPTAHLKSTDPSGNLAASSFPIVDGVTGPPTSGTDSAGHPATTDAMAYPCPPTAVQITAGDTCSVAFGDSSGASASAVISFAGGGGGTTTTTASTTTTTTTAGSTTTTTTPAGTTTTTTLPPRNPDTPSYSLACTAASIPVNLPGAVTEGQFKTDPVNAGSVDNLAANPKAVPDSLFGLYDASSNPNGVNLLNGPDTGLGLVVQFPASLEPLTTPGDTVTFTGTVPLSVTGGIGTPSLSVSGSFKVPTSYPTNAAVAIPATQSGSITAGQGTSMTITQPQFTSGSPLALTISIGTTNVPMTCTSSAVETLDTAAITGGNGTPTPPNPPSPGTVGSGTSTSPSTSAGTTAATPSSASSLAFTGPGPGVWVLAIGGLILINLGFLIMTIYYKPSEMLVLAGRRVRRTFGGSA
jgi:hypothetical protein